MQQLTGVLDTVRYSHLLRSNICHDIFGENDVNIEFVY